MFFVEGVFLLLGIRSTRLGLSGVLFGTGIRGALIPSSFNVHPTPAQTLPLIGVLYFNELTVEHGGVRGCRCKAKVKFTAFFFGWCGFCLAVLDPVTQISKTHR